MTVSITECVIYARISSDDGRGLGVQRQIDDCTAEAGRRQWRVAHIYVDNDVSASTSKRRPEFERMLADIRAGQVPAVVVWDVDRLTRTPRELEDIIDLADKHGLGLASVGGEIDLSTPQGRLTARLKGSVARHETDQQSRRLKRKMRERAEAGRPHSFAAYGYRRVLDVDDRGRVVGSRDELNEAEAETVRDAARMLLDGRSLRSVVAELNGRGSTSARGLPWSSMALRQVMLRERNAGHRVHLKQIIGKGQWPAIYDQGTHERVIALLTDPGRTTSKGSARKHLLTGIARCGVCPDGGDMIVNPGRVATTVKGGTKRQPPAYVCRTCTRLRRKQSAVDDYVTAVMVGRLSRPDALDALATGDPATVTRAREEAAALTARLDRAADEYADNGITGDQLRRITDRLRPQIERAKFTAAANMPAPGLANLVGVDAPARWEAAPLEAKRAVIDVLCTITILPSGPGKPFDPSLIDIKWRTNE